MWKRNLIAALAISSMVLSGCAGKVSKPEAKPEAKAAVVAKTNDDLLEKTIQQAAAVPIAATEGTGWKTMFDGHSLAGWKETEFGGRGPVRCESGLMVLDTGDGLTGANWTNDVPKVDYEISLEATRLQGSDFFCGLTFPVADSRCSLILGGWGGAIVGLSCLDGADASENETTQFVKFETGQMYHVRVRVTSGKIEAWLEGKQIINVATEGKKISMRFGEIELSAPLGVASYSTTAACRAIKVRRLN